MTSESSAVPMTAVRRAIALRDVEAFRSVPMDQLAQIAAAAREEWMPAGGVLFREGEPPGALYVILQGRVRLERQGEVFGQAKGGEPLGTWSLFDDHPRRATATCDGDTRVLALDRDGELVGRLAEYGAALGARDPG